MTTVANDRNVIDHTTLSPDFKRWLMRQYFLLYFLKVDGTMNNAWSRLIRSLATGTASLGLRYAATTTECLTALQRLYEDSQQSKETP